MLAAAELSSAITDFEYGLQCIQQAQQLFQQLGDQRGEIDARLKYCDLAGLAGKYRNLEVQAKEALRMAEQMSYKAGIAKAKGVLGSIVYDADMPEAALQYHLPNVTLWRELDSPFELAKALINLGVALLEIGEYMPARQAFLEAETSFVRWVTSVASPRPYITWEKPLKRWGTMFTPGNYSANRCAFVTIWVYHEAIPTRLNCSLRSTKGKNATNKRFNFWQQPKPCGYALEHHSNK